MPAWEDKRCCEICNIEFSLTFRRHHCRTCKKCVCNTCSPSTVKLDGTSGLQRICTPCAGVTARALILNKGFIDVGERLHSMVGARVSGSQSDSLDDTLEFCKAALAPLQTALIESQQKLIAAETRARELDARMRAAQELVVSCAKQLYKLAGGERTRLALPSPSSSLMRLLEFCNELIRPLTQEYEKQSATMARATQAEVAVARGEKERVRLENLLCEAKAFCKDACDRLKSMKIDIRVDVQTTTEEIYAEGGQAPKLQRLKSGEDLYCANAAKSWAQDTTHCTICKAEFGMMSMKRRHHCRICGQCVCNTCSPSTVQLKGYPTLERVCTPCISNSQRAPEMRATAVELATRMNVICGLKAPVASQLGTLAEALAFCESALAPIESLLGSSGGAEGKATEGEIMQLQVVEARAETLKVKRELTLVASELSVVKGWTRWAHESATTLGQHLEGVTPQLQRPEVQQQDYDLPFKSEDAIVHEKLEIGRPNPTSEELMNVISLGQADSHGSNSQQDDPVNPFGGTVDLEQDNSFRDRADTNPFGEEHDHESDQSNPFHQADNKNPF